MLNDVFTEAQVTELLKAFEPKKIAHSFWDDCPNFKPVEFECKCGGRYCNGDTAQPVESLVKALQTLRNISGKPVIISSGVRCPRHNANVGGVYNSNHLSGHAADFAISGISAHNTISIVKSAGIKYKELYAIDSDYVHIAVN